MKKTGIIAIIMMGIMAIVAVLYLGLSYSAQTTETFSESGYVLVPDALNSDAKQQNFLAGTTYKSGTGDTFVFQNDLGEEVTVTEDSFLHYSDGSISSMAQGVIAKMDEIENVGFMNYYSLSPQTILRASGDGYSVDNQGVALEFTDFIWKISDNKYVLVSDSVDVHFSDDDIREVSGFVEVSYVDDSVVRIQTEDNLWQTISPNCYATLADGKIVDFNNRLVTEAGATEPIFYLTNMVINADDNIPIYNQKEVDSADLTIPEFDIKVEDGADGIAGVEGTSGELGIDGEEGEKGEEGDEGEQGDDGDEGDSGSAGSSGSSGSSGSDGSTGATGGAAGDTGDGTDTESEENTSIPVFTVTDWTVGAESISCTITAENVDGLYDQDEPWIYIYESATSKLVYYEQHDFASSIFEGTLPSTSFDALTPDTQYRLVVFGTYADGDKVYQKDFVSKTFYTDSTGISFNGLYSTEDSLIFEITDEDFSTVRSVEVYVFESESAANNCTTSGSTDAVTSEVISEFDEPTTFNLEDYYAAGTTLSDRTYYIRLVVTTEDNQTIMINQVYSMKTLKEPAVLDTPTVYEVKSTYSFDVYPNVSDPDNAITKCTYHIYDANDYIAYEDGDQTELPDEVCSEIVVYNADVTSIPLASNGLSANTEYKIVMEVEYYDNEKTVTLTSGASNTVSMVGGTMPTVSFKFSTDPDTKESTGTDATTSGTVATSKMHESITGMIYLSGGVGGTGTDTSSTVKTGESYPVTVSVTASGVYNNVMSFTDLSASTGTDNTIEVPIDLSSLQHGTSYTFTVSAYVDFNDMSSISNVTLGSFVVQTPYANTTTVTMYSNAEGTDSFGVNILLSDYKVDDETTESAAYSMDTAEMMEITLYSSDKSTVIGTPVYLWDESDTMKDSSFADDYYNKTIYISADDFKGNLTLDGYWVTITKFYDYTYGTVLTAGNSLDEAYITTFANEIPMSGTTEVYVRVTDQPPDDPDYPGGGIDATAIMNMDAADYGATKDESLPDDTIIGYLVSSTYDNSSALALTIQYHIFENNTYNNFSSSAYSSYSGDIYDWSNTDSCEIGVIKDPITAGAALYETGEIGTVNNKIPEVVFLFEALPEGTSQGEVAPSSGTAVRYVYYTGEYNHDAKEGVSRGMQLMFAYTAGLNTDAGTTVTKYYPYCIWENPTETFTTTSYTQDVPKAKPLIYAYPWASADTFTSGSSFATWRYWTYDADGSVKETATNSGKAEWQKDGFIYAVSGESVLPGAIKVSTSALDYGMTATEFADYEYGGSTISTPATMTISTSSTVPSTADFGYVAIPLSNSGNSMQMAIDVELYLTEIYEDDLSLLNTNYCETGTDGKVLTELPVFRVYDSIETISNIGDLSTPVWNLDPEYNTYSVNFSNLFSTITKGSTAGTLYDRLVGVLLQFEKKGTDAVVQTSLNLYKTLGDNSIISGNTSDLATVVGTNVDVSMYYLYASSNIGFYNVTSGAYGYAVRQFNTNGEPTYRTTESPSGDLYPSYMISYDDTWMVSTRTAPAMGSFFTNGANYLTLADSATMNVYSKETSVSLGNVSAANQVNMDYDGSYKTSYMTPVALNTSGEIVLKTGQTIDHTIPLVYFDTTDGVTSELESITMKDVYFSGATSDNIGTKIYFKIEYKEAQAQEAEDSTITYTTVVPGYESMKELTIIDPDGTYDITFDDLEINKEYKVTVYAYQNGGTVNSDYLVQLLDGTSSTTPQATYYLNTLQEVEIAFLYSTPKYIVSSYWDKYVQVNYSVSTKSGYTVTYKIYNCAADEITDEKEPYFVQDEGSNVMDTNGIQLGFGPYGYLYSGAGVDEEDHMQLPAGTYTLVIEANSKVEDGEESELLGSATQEFVVEDYATPNAIILPTAKVEQNDDGSYTHGATIAVIIQDEGCQITAGEPTEYDSGATPYGDYVVYVYKSGTDTVVYSGEVSSTYGASYFYPTDLTSETPYDIVIYAILDEDEDGKAEDEAGTELMSLTEYVTAGYIAYWRTLMLSTGGSSNLPDDVFTATSQFTTKEDTTVVYDSTAFALKNGYVGVRFTGASGLNGGIDKIYYNIYYIDDDKKGSWIRSTIENPTFDLESSSTNTYWLALAEITNVTSSAYFQITVSYDYNDEGDDEWDGTWSYTGYLYS